MLIRFNALSTRFRREFEINCLGYKMWPYWTYYQWRRLIQSYFPNFISSKERKSIIVIVLETLYLAIYWKCMPFHYFRYSLYKKGIPKNLLKSYIPETVFYYKLLPHLNQNYCLLDNKLLCSNILEAHNILTPQQIVYAIDGILFNAKTRQKINSEEEFLNILKRLTSDEIIGKEINCGSGGHQILFFRRIKNDFISNTGDLLSFKSLSSGMFNNWMFQEVYENSDQLKGIYNLSLNTFRIITYYNKGNVMILYAMLKFGNCGERTDNAHTGGIYIKVNPQSGILDDHAYDEEQNIYYEHPFSHQEFKNIKILNWEKVVNVSISCAEAFPDLRFIGWDIAITTKGVIVIEGNSSPGLTIIQRTHNGMPLFLEICKNERLL